MNIKNTIKTKIQNMLGLNSLEKHLRDIKATNIISQLKFDNSLQDEWLLACFPTHRGGIKSTNKIENLKKYLNLIKPIKWGGGCNALAEKMMAVISKQYQK